MSFFGLNGSEIVCAVPCFRSRHQHVNREDYLSIKIVIIGEKAYCPALDFFL